MMRKLALILFALIAGPVAGPVAGEVVTYAAPDGTAQAQLVTYSTLDNRLAAALIAAFQRNNPGVAVRYENLLAGDIAARVVAETNNGWPAADFVFSSAMDLQIKLANDGYARAVTVSTARYWPPWAYWQNTAFALTFEPGVLVYTNPAFRTDPRNRGLS